MVDDLKKLFKHYTKRTGFLLDLMALIPTDFLRYAGITTPLIRLNK